MLPAVPVAHEARVLVVHHTHLRVMSLCYEIPESDHDSGGVTVEPVTGSFLQQAQLMYETPPLWQTLTVPRYVSFKPNANLLAYHAPSKMPKGATHASQRYFPRARLQR